MGGLVIKGYGQQNLQSFQFAWFKISKISKHLNIRVHEMVMNSSIHNSSTTSV